LSLIIFPVKNEGFNTSQIACFLATP
jgi:hypothetical protein